MRATYAEKKERKRQRDAIRELAWKSAQHVALGDLNTVERVTRHGYPAFQFGLRIDRSYCECGMPYVPLPTFSKRWGVLPTFYCVVCNLPRVVEACERIRAEVAPHAPARPTPRRKATA